MVCAEFEHMYPSETSTGLPITAPVPADYAARWFLKSTWDNIEEEHESLKLPTIRRQSAIFLLERFNNGRFEDILHAQEEDLWQTPDMDLRDSLIVRQRSEADSSARSTAQASMGKSPQSNRTVTGHTRQHVLGGPKSQGQDTLWSLHDLIVVLPKIDEASSAQSGKIITWYEKERRKDLEEAANWDLDCDGFTKPHSYWHLTQFCCPYIQTELDLERDELASKRYQCSRCRHCEPLVAEDVDPPLPKVPFSMRVEGEYRLKRAHNKYKHQQPLNDQFVQHMRTKRKFSRRSDQRYSKKDLAELDLASYTLRTS